MKTPITVRIHSDLLNAARAAAARENRTLTNFIETVLRARVGWAAEPPYDSFEDETQHGRDAP